MEISILYRLERVDFHQSRFISFTFTALEILHYLFANICLWVTVCVMNVFCRCGYPKGSMTNLDHLLSTGNASRFAFFQLVLIFGCMLSGWGTIWFGWYSEFLYYCYYNLFCPTINICARCLYLHVGWIANLEILSVFQSLLELGVF